MRLIKRKSKKTYLDKEKIEHHYTNYFIEFDNGKRVLIKPVKVEDYARLDMVAEYER